MQIDRKEVISRINPTDKVLDIGVSNDIFPRANTIIDLMPYENRKNNYPNERECFSKDTWIIGDINTQEVWSKFKDKEFDFSICSHLLEDIRDPLFVCTQLIRVSKRGYIECPSMFRECAKINSESSFSGYDHHRWIFQVIDNSLVFTPKLGWAHHFDYLGDSRRKFLKVYQFHFTGVFWNNSFSYYERTPKGTLMQCANLLFFYDNYDYYNGKFIYEIKDSDSVVDGKCLWIDEYFFDVEKNKDYEKYLNMAKKHVTY